MAKRWLAEIHEGVGSFVALWQDVLRQIGRRLHRG